MATSSLASSCRRDTLVSSSASGSCLFLWGGGPWGRRRAVEGEHCLLGRLPARLGSRPGASLHLRDHAQGHAAGHYRGFVHRVSTIWEVHAGRRGAGARNIGSN